MLLGLNKTQFVKSLAGLEEGGQNCKLVFFILIVSRECNYQDKFISANLLKKIE